jgi:hypothetical protein
MQDRISSAFSLPAKHLQFAAGMGWKGRCNAVLANWQSISSFSSRTLARLVHNEAPAHSQVFLLAQISHAWSVLSSAIALLKNASVLLRLLAGQR